MATNKSISFDEDLIIDLQHKAKQKGVGFSPFINDILKEKLYGKKHDEIDINTHINNIIILNNNILLLYKLVESQLSFEIEKKNKEKEKLEKLKEKLSEDNLTRFNELKELFAKYNVLGTIESTDFNNPNDISNLRMDLKEQNIPIKIDDLFDFHRINKIINPKKG